MKLLFFSDIHGIKKNLNKLDKIIEKEKPDKIIVLGDLYYRGYNTSSKGMIDNQQVFDFLTKHKNNLIVTKGNCDSEQDIKELDGNLEYTSIMVDHLKFYLAHGDKYSYHNPVKKRSILIYGHGHIPYIRKKDNVIYICVGSISLPRNDLGATYMIYQNKKFTIYNIDNEIIDEYEIKEERK